MGLFLNIVIVKGRGIFPVKKYLRLIAESSNNFGIEPGECIIRPASKGTLVQLNSPYGYKELASALSVQSKGEVLLCYIYDDDFWGYHLYNNGEEAGCFCPIPDYFGDMDEEEALSMSAGDAEILSCIFDVPVERISNYFCRWTDLVSEEKAYPEDKYGYEACQMADFIKALGFTFPKAEDKQAADTEVLNGTTPGSIQENNINIQETKQETEEKTLPVVSAKERYHFQVNLGGMLDILSNHLYKSPDVFIRELLQNGVDAITMRQKKQPGWNNGCITITVVPGKRIEFKDNGAGLNEEEIHRFLAVIGQSSKTQLVNGQIPEDYIGRFGIGLLSCFMVSGSIIVNTVPADGSPAHVWTGFPDGTYTLDPLDMGYLPYNASGSAGTTVILQAKADSGHYFQADKVAELVRYYGLALPVPVYIAGSAEKLNNVPADFSGISRSQLLSFGDWLFGEEFLDAIPVQTPHLSGVAYILPYRTDSSVKSGHRIYLKQMLLTEEGDTLLPSWAFFLRCFLNTRNLRPTASREDFYEDKELESAREEFEDAIRVYLEKMAHCEDDRLKRIVNTHVQAIKSMSVWDDRLFHLFIDYLPFETSEGTYTGELLKKVGEADWIGSVSRFNQLRPLYMAQGRLLICAGYVYDEELIRKLAHMYSLPLAPFQEESMDFVLEELQPYEYQRMEYLSSVANKALHQFDCKTEIRRFLPMDLPVLYSLSDEVQFLRQLQSAKDVSTSIFSDALSSLLNSVEERPLATLYLNLNSQLIQRLSQITDKQLLKSISRVLYVQAMLAGGHPLRGGELKVMNKELLNLVEYNLGQEE
ncbi:MAG: HSP90 family protein [Lachnospiraceae bacterium]|jgi:Molecular chaperone, HSP90 family